MPTLATAVPGKNKEVQTGVAAKEVHVPMSYCTERPPNHQID